jgi:endo-1,4-beta-xylanase
MDLGPVTLTNTEEAGSRTGGVGTHSLRTTGRTVGFHGPSLNTLALLTKGATYQVSVWARLVAGEAPAQLRVTMQRTVGGTNNFDTVAQSAAGAVTDGAWVQMTGLYAFAGADPSGLLLYVESTTATTSFYIDDFRIDKIADPPGLPPNTTGLSSTFETGTAEGWTSRTGVEVVAASNADAHTGSFSLLTTNRTSSFRGPNFDVTNVMFNGSRYRVSVWAKLAPGGGGPARVSLQRNAGTITTFHTVVPNTTVTASAWVRPLRHDVALANSALFLYVESGNYGRPAPVLYIDDVQPRHPPLTIEPTCLAARAAGRLLPHRRAVSNVEISGVHGTPEEALQQHHLGNDMKWTPPEPTRTFVFTNADQQVARPGERDGVRGHRPLWHQQISPGSSPIPSRTAHAADDGQPRPSRWRARRTTSATWCCTWRQGVRRDVVNEVIDESRPTACGAAPRFNITGTDSTPPSAGPRGGAFRTLLFINEFNPTIPNKRQCPSTWSAPCRPGTCLSTGSGTRCTTTSSSSAQSGRHSRPVRGLGSRSTSPRWTSIYPAAPTPRFRTTTRSPPNACVRPATTATSSGSSRRTDQLVRHGLGLADLTWLTPRGGSTARCSSTTSLPSRPIPPS